MNESWRVIYGLQAVLQKLSIAVWLRAHGKFVRPELTVKQRQELKECFELIDADGSGAIDASEMLTAFNVLGMHVKKSEVEAMLAEVDADGSGEVEYPEFVQIMTTKLDKQNEDAYAPKDDRKPTKQQPLPFPLLARAYRRKKLMEAVMGGDKATQERLQARADAAENERQAMMDEAINRTKAIKSIKQKAFTSIASQRIRRGAKLKRQDFKKLHVTEVPLPAYVIENMDADVKTVLSNIHEQASLQRTSMAGARDKANAVVTSNWGANMKDKAKEQEKKKNIADGKDRGGDKKMDTDVSQEDLKEMISEMKGPSKVPYNYKEEFEQLAALRKIVRHKPTLEQQLLHVRAIKSLHDYFKTSQWDDKGSTPQHSIAPYVPPMSPSAIVLGHDQTNLTHPNKQKMRPHTSSLGELGRPRWN
ncbi:unnamed protein product [Sphagnum compactum]